MLLVPLRTLVNEATDLARNLLHQPKQGSVPPTQESSMLEALDSIAGDLQGFKMIKDITLQEEKDATISKEQAKKWIQSG